MGTTLNKSSNTRTVTEDADGSVYKFKPYKFFVDHNVSRLRCQQVQFPKPRSGHRIVTDDNHIYSFGGYNPSLTAADENDLAETDWPQSKPLFKELWQYNISRHMWEKLEVAEIPDILASNAAILSGFLLLVFGGTGVPFGANCSKDLFICNLNNTGDQLKFNLIPASGNSPLPQYGQAVVLIDHYLYTIGGTTGFDYTCDIHRLNLKDQAWEIVYVCKGLSNEPAGRYRHEIALYNNKIHVLGGGTAMQSFPFVIIFAFNLATREWERIRSRPDNKALEAYPSPRRCHSSVLLDNCTYIIGGFTGDFVLRDIWKLDLDTYQWTKIRRFTLDRGLYFHSSCLTSYGKLITFGGIIQAQHSSERTAIIQSAWLGIPKLKEICWEAVLYYHTDINTLSEETLISYGIPVEFIRRLGL